MRAGALDRRITVQRSIPGRDGFNALVDNWTDLATLWAAYSPVSDGERLRAGERAAEIGARFQIRWSALAASVTAVDRVVFEGRSFAITNVKEIGRREGLELTTVARGEPL